MDSESSSDEEDEAVNEDTMPILHVSSFSKCTAVNLAMNFTCFASQFAHLLHYSNMLCVCMHVQLKKVAHAGCVNRIRSMNQEPHICATWGDTGHVQVFYFVLQYSFFFYSF